MIGTRGFERLPAERPIHGLVQTDVHPHLTRRTAVVEIANGTSRMPLDDRRWPIFAGRDCLSERRI